MASRLPLFDWTVSEKHRCEIERLETERSLLAERIGRLPPMSHKRVGLQTRLKVLTAQAMQIENTVSREAVL